MQKPDMVLIDADSLLYQAAYAGTVESVAYSTDDTEQDVINPDKVRAVVDEKVDLWRAAAEGEGGSLPVKFFLSDRANKTFRYYVYDDYKANRKKPRPAMFYTAHDYLMEEYGDQIKVVPGLEADDAVSMMARDMVEYDTAPVVVSIDKDMRQIPGYHVEPKDTLETSRRFSIPAKAAKHALWAQVLSGDTSDNYKGAPGVGKARVAKEFDGLFGKPDAVYYSRVRDVFADQWSNPRWREKFVTGGPLEELVLNYRMVRLLHPDDYCITAAGNNAIVRLHHPQPGAAWTDLAVPLKQEEAGDGP